MLWKRHHLLLNQCNAKTRFLFLDVKKLSSVVLEHFSPMIPKRFRAVWKKGIDTNAYYLKLCGSGGGGYILGFTQDLPKAKSILADHQLEVVYTF